MHLLPLVLLLGIADPLDLNIRQVRLYDREHEITNRIDTPASHLRPLKDNEDANLSRFLKSIGPKEAGVNL